MRDADVRVTFEDSTGARAPTTIAFRRDATKRGKVVRVPRRRDGTRDAARARRRRGRDDATASIARVRSRDDRRSRRDVRARYLPPLSRLRDSRETTQRQFGTLGACGAAVQVRFGDARTTTTRAMRSMDR